MRFSIVLLAFSILLGATTSEKDDSYYTAGTGNPNTAQTMYWKDGENVLQDLSKFSSLYVVFHQCAWTWMQMDDDGNDVEENDYWYMGKIPPMGANVAYSLYGTLKGKAFSGCGKDTFINTFYTDQGFNVFVDAMYLAGVSAFSTPYNTGLTAQCQGGYGVGCDYNSGFVVHKYASSQCNPQNATSINDNLSTLNSAMNNYAKCVKIYDSNKYSGYTEGTPLALLEYSHSCFYQDMFSPDGSCPDPYGKLAQYQTNFHKGITESRRSDPYQIYYYRRIYEKQINQGKTLLRVGLACIAAAAVLFIWNENIIGRFVLQRATRRGNKKISTDDRTEAVNSRAEADVVIEKAEAGIKTPRAQTKARRETFIGRTIEVCGDIKQTGTMDPGYLNESAAFATDEYNEANAAFDRMCTAGGDACVDAADEADIMMFASRSFNCENDLLEGQDSFDGSYSSSPLFKGRSTSNNWAKEVDVDDEVLRRAQLAETRARGNRTENGGHENEEKNLRLKKTDSSDCSVYLESESETEEKDKKVQPTLDMSIGNISHDIKAARKATREESFDNVDIAKAKIDKKVQMTPDTSVRAISHSIKAAVVPTATREDSFDAADLANAKTDKTVQPTPDTSGAISHDNKAAVNPTVTREGSLDAADIAKAKIAKILNNIKPAAWRGAATQAKAIKETLASLDLHQPTLARDLMPSIVDIASDLEDQQDQRAPTRR